jgi:hypothetical protein
MFCAAWCCTTEEHDSESDGPISFGHELTLLNYISFELKCSFSFTHGYCCVVLSEGNAIYINMDIQGKIKRKLWKLRKGNYGNAIYK